MLIMAAVVGDTDDAVGLSKAKSAQRDHPDEPKINQQPPDSGKNTGISSRHSMRQVWPHRMPADGPNPTPNLLRMALGGQRFTGGSAVTTVVVRKAPSLRWNAVYRGFGTSPLIAGTNISRFEHGMWIPWLFFHVNLWNPRNNSYSIASGYYG